MGYQWEHWAWLGAFLWNSPQDTCRGGFQFRGRTKGGRKCKLESSLAEMCPTPGPNLEMTGQEKKKKSRKLTLPKQPKLPLVDATHSAHLCAPSNVSCCFHTHALLLPRVFCFWWTPPPRLFFCLTILISAEFFKEDKNRSPFFSLSPPESAPNSSFKTCSAGGIPFKRLSFAVSTLPNSRRR